MKLERLNRRYVVLPLQRAQLAFLQTPPGCPLDRALARRDETEQRDDRAQNPPGQMPGSQAQRDSTAAQYLEGRPGLAALFLRDLRHARHLARVFRDLQAI